MYLRVPIRTRHLWHLAPIWAAIFVGCSSERTSPTPTRSGETPTVTQPNEPAAVEPSRQPPRDPVAAESTQEAIAVKAPLMTQQSPLSARRQSAMALEMDDELNLDPNLLRDQAGMALQQGDVAEARRLIRTAIRIAPNDPQTRFVLAMVLGEEHRYHEAIRLLDQVAEQEPSAALPALGQTAQWLVVQGEWSQAEQRYRAVLEEFPDAAIAHRQLAQLLLRQGRRQDAMQHLEALLLQGNIEEAELRALLSASRVVQGESFDEEREPIGSLGNARYRIGQDDPKGAIEALQLDAERSDEADALLGRLWAEAKDTAALNSWIKEQDGSESWEMPDALFARAVAASEAGKPREAIRLLCRTIEADPTDAIAYQELSRQLTAVDAKELADATSQRAESIARTQQIASEMAASETRQLQTIGELVELLQELRRPLQAIAWTAVGLAYAQSSMPPDAFQQAIAELNRDRAALLQSGDDHAQRDFVLCGVDPDKFPD